MSLSKVFFLSSEIEPFSNTYNLSEFSQKFGLSEVFLGPGGFKKLRETCTNFFHLVAPPKTSVVTSYDQKTKKLTTKKATTTLM